MGSAKAGMLERIFSKFQNELVPVDQHSEMWNWFLKAKGSYHSVDDMLRMRAPESSITRGFGLDLRYSPSFEAYTNSPLYKTLLAIPESDFGQPEKIFPVSKNGKRSGIFLRNLAYAYELIETLNRSPDSQLTILEIGGGFGMLAYILKKYFPKARFILTDLPESLAICAWYLENVFPEYSFAYQPADAIDATRNADFLFVTAGHLSCEANTYDLAINCDSMSEMDKLVAGNYLRIIEGGMKERGQLFFINKENIAKNGMPRPTAYPFSEKWLIKKISPTYVGFIDDYRHIQIIFEWQAEPSYRPALRNAFLDLSYIYFFNENLYCFEFFSVLEIWEHLAAINEEIWAIFEKTILDSHSPSDEHMASDFDAFGSPLERKLGRMIAFVRANNCLASHNRTSGLSYANMLLCMAENFLDYWAVNSIYTDFGEKWDHVDCIRRGLKRPLPHSYVLQKAGKILATNQVQASRDIFQSILQDSSSSMLAVIEAMKNLKSVPTNFLKAKEWLADPSTSIAYYFVRIAQVLENKQDALALLDKVTFNEVQAGHYDLFIAASEYRALGDFERSQLLLERALKICHNDNGFYRRAAQLYESLGQNKKACDLYNKSLEVDASWASTHFDLARLYRKLNDIEMEIKHLIEADLCGKNKEVDYTFLKQRLHELASSRQSKL